MQCAYGVDRQARARATTCADNGDIDGGACGVSQIPDRGCVAVAEDGAFSAGKYGGRPPTLSSDRTNGIDTSMQTPKPSIGDTTPDRRGVDSQRSQLPESYYPVLSTCESADERVKDAHHRHRQGVFEFSCE